MSGAGLSFEMATRRIWCGLFSRLGGGGGGGGECVGGGGRGSGWRMRDKDDVDVHSSRRCWRLEFEI